MTTNQSPVGLLQLLASLVAALLGNTLMSGVESAITEIDMQSRQDNHALAEGAPTWRAYSEKEEVEFILRYCRENRFYTPWQHDFVDDFMYHVGDAYQTRPEVFETDGR